MAITAALAVVATLGMGAKAEAATIQLGFILDRSGSIGSGPWAVITGGLANAVGTKIPLAGVDTYEVSVVTFSSAATIDISNFLVTDATSRTALATAIAALPFSGGGTAFGPAFTAMKTAFAASTATDISKSYVNFATDGVESDRTAGIAARNALIAAGTDNISIEGIGGGIDETGLQNDYCYPGPCDTTSPYNFPAQGFYIGVLDAQGYADAIGAKIEVVVTPVPEPTSMLLLGTGLVGLVARLRRRQK